MTEPWSKHWNATWLAAFARVEADVPLPYRVALMKARQELAVQERIAA